jgi:CHASE2 domain-containing sensor protein
MIESRPRREAWTTTTALSAILFASVLALFAVPLFRELQLKINDTLFRLAPVPRKKSPLVLILIDDESLREYGRWPWSRALLAKLVRGSTEAGATVIGVDILLSEPQSAEADAMLIHAIERGPHIVLADKIGFYPDGPHWLEPLQELLSANVSVGHALAPLDKDGVCRRFPPLELSPDGVRWAFSVEVARHIDLQRVSDFLKTYKVGETTDAGAYAHASPVLAPIAFRRGPFQTISAADVLKGRNLTIMDGRPVLIGFGPVELGDRIMTPLGGVIPTPGIEVNAQILDSILSGRRIRESTLPVTLGLVLLACPLLVIAYRRVHRRHAVALMVAVGITIYGLAYTFFVGWELIVPAAPFLAADLLAPLVIFSADFYLIERSLTTQLRGLEQWLFPVGTVGRATLIERHPSSNLSWKLRTLEGLQTELGALYEFHQTLLESTDGAVAIFDGKDDLILSNRHFDALPTPGGNKIRTLAAALDQWTPHSAKGAATDQEIYIDDKLYGVSTAALPPTKISPRGGTLLTITSLQLRQERDRARSEALGFLTHELRTPLASIQQYAELMVEYPRSPLAARAPETIFRESVRLLALIGSYLDVLRLDAGALPIRAEKVNLETLTDEVFAILRPLATAQSMPLQFSSNQAVVAIADPPLLTGAILNLVSNAIKYGAKGTPIEVHAAIVERDVLLSITNEAAEIGSLDLRRFFDAYFRSTSVEDNTPGWGLGLAFVKRIAEKHGGSIEATTQDSQITITLRLPIALDEQPEKDRA